MRLYEVKDSELAVHSKALIQLLSIHFMLLAYGVWFCVGSVFCGVDLGVLSSLAIILPKKRKSVA